MIHPRDVATRRSPRRCLRQHAVGTAATLLVGAVIAVSAHAHAAAPTGAIVAAAAAAAVAAEDAPPQGDAERGFALYDAHCAGCHGPTGRGDGPLVDRLPAPPPSLADRTRMAALSPADLWTTVTNGRLERSMPPFNRLLTDSERWDVVAAVRAMGDQHPLRLAGADIGWSRDCASCHGEADEFAGQLATAPLLPEPDGPPGVDGLAVRSPAAMRAAFDGVAAHAAASVDPQLTDVALAGLRRRGSRPLVLPGTSFGGRIEGRVLMPSGEAANAARTATVTLQATAMGLDVDLGPVPLTPDGAFAVDDLVVGDGIAYEPAVWFDGVRYRPTDVVTLTAQAPSRTDVGVRVFAADASAPVRIAALSGLAKADIERGEVAVFEVWQIANDGQRTRVSADGAPTFRLPLPIGARDVVLEDRSGREPVAQRGDASDEGFIVSRLPVPPGGREIVASYGMPYRGTTAMLERTMSDGAEQLGWVLADEGAEADSPQLSGPTADQFGGRPVQRYVGGPLSAGEGWTIRISGLPPAVAAPASAQAVLGPAPKALVSQSLVRRAAQIGAAVAALVALMAGFNLRRIRRRGRPNDRALGAYGGVIAAVARLDADFERGEIAPNTYRRRRAALVGRAMALRAAVATDGPSAASGAGEREED